MQKKNYFIAIEGIDGSGKDTQYQQLAKALREKGELKIGSKYNNVWLTREPTNMTSAGRELNELIKKGDISPEDALPYFIKDRIEHSHFISQVLEHSHVLGSRYDLSTFAYQSLNGMSFEEIYNQHGFAEEKLLIPDVTVIIDIPAKVSLERTAQRAMEVASTDEKQSHFSEKLEFLEKFSQNYREVAKWWQEKGRTVLVINGNQAVTDVTAEMIKRLNGVL